MRPRTTLQVEALEDRLVMNTYFVVPGVANNTTSFSTLHDALTKVSHQPGDIIQIEPGSSPGHITNADVPAVQHLTIQGDPGADVRSIPYFYLDTPMFIGSAQQGLTLKNVELDTSGGTLEFLTDGTITGCRIINDSAGISVALQGTTSFVINDSVFVNANPNDQSQSLVTVQPADGSHNRIDDNQFIALTGSEIVLLNYAGGANTTDIVDHNTFIASTGIAPLFVVQQDNQGLTLESNTFTDNSPGGTAVEVHPSVENLQIQDNVINVTGGGFLSDGILVDAGTGPNPPTQSSSMVIANNHIHTAGEGSGIEITGENGWSIFAKVQGNDLQENETGVQIDAGLGGPVTGIDLGGGPLGSLGGNDFRGDSNGNWWFPSGYAIWVGASAAAGPISAMWNIYGVDDPRAVIHDNSNDPTVAVVNSANPLTGNAAYVETLYLDFLHRTGDLGNPGGAGGWVNDLNVGMPAAVVASAIARSPEALGVDVDNLYHRYLGRDADAAGRAGFVGYLQAGGTLEAVSQAILASPEYQSHFPGDAAFVESLYENLLHRMASSTEINNWLTFLPQVGRAGVAAGFLSSQEFRDGEVGDDYAQMLHRNPSTGELNAWVFGGADILTIDTFFASSPEFQVNG
jgi:hypothetical protein